MLETKSIMLKMPEVVPEHLLVEVAEEMEFLNANVSSLQSPLEQTPKVFEAIGMHAPVNVPFCMVNDLVLEPLLPQALIGHERVSVDCAPCFDVRDDMALQSMFATIADNGGANLTSAPIKSADDCGLVFGASLSNPALALVSVHESGSTTDESFVYFHFAAGAAHFYERAILHCKADSVEHEP